MYHKYFRIQYFNVFFNLKSTTQMTFNLLYSNLKKLILYLLEYFDKTGKGFLEDLVKGVKQPLKNHELGS